MIHIKFNVFQLIISTNSVRIDKYPFDNKLNYFTLLFSLKVVIWMKKLIQVGISGLVFDNVIPRKVRHLPINA